MSADNEPVDPLRPLTEEEAAGVVKLSAEQINAALKEGEKERDAVESIAQQPQNVDPSVRFR